jgi:iron(III) transport system permease protein
MLPLMKTAFISALIYIFIRGMVTLSAVIFLVSPGYNLASVSILNQVEAGRLGAAAALSTLLLAFVLGAVALLRLAVRKERVAIFSV